MSSTNRKGNNPKRATLDYYPTPSWAVHRLIDFCDLPSGLWLEPCAGDGAIIKAVNDKRPDITWAANEIQSEMIPKLEAIPNIMTFGNNDFLVAGNYVLEDLKVVITNPPFTLAMECVKKSLELGADYVVFLLRLNFLASKGRSQFMSEHTPDIYVLSTRPAFTSDGQRDSIDYAWFVWHRDRAIGTPGKLVIIPNKDKK